MSELPLHSPIRQTRSQTIESTQFYTEPPARSRSPRKRAQKPTIEPHDSQSETNLTGESIPSGPTTEDDPFRDRFNIHRSPPSQQPRQVQMPPSPIPASSIILLRTVQSCLKKALHLEVGLFDLVLRTQCQQYRH